MLHYYSTGRGCEGLSKEGVVKTRQLAPFRRPLLGSPPGDSLSMNTRGNSKLRPTGTVNCPGMPQLRNLNAEARRTRLRDLQVDGLLRCWVVWKALARPSLDLGISGPPTPHP